MPKTIIEQAVYNVAGERVPFIKDSFTTEVCREALRLFCKRIENERWVSLSDGEEKEERELGGFTQEQIDDMFNIWIPYHGWQQLKKQAGFL